MLDEKQFMELNEKFQKLFEQQEPSEPADWSRLCLIAYEFREHIAASFVQEEYDGHPH